MTPNELRKRRLAIYMTQAELAEEFGVSANTVARWERGEMAIAHPVMVEAILKLLEAEPISPERAARHNARMIQEMDRKLAEAEANLSPERDIAEAWFGNKNIERKTTDE